MPKIVTSEFTISQVVPPSLPQAPAQYQPQYISQHNNVLRLYFNQIAKILDQMKAGEALGDYADDTAAAAAGVPLDGVYRTGSVLKIRVT
jgi:hypothetical protein